MSQPVAIQDMFPSIESDADIEVKCHNTCPKCGKEEDYTRTFPAWAGQVFQGGERKQICQSCLEKMENKKKEEAKKDYIEELMDHAKIPKNFLNWDKSRGNAELGRKIRDSRHLSLFIVGANDCGKTRAAAFNLLLEIKSGLRCRFIRFTELAASYARVCKMESENSMDYIESVLADKIVLIDDIAKRRITRNAGELLYEIFDRVYAGDCESRIWVTCNLSLGNLANRFESVDTGDAVVSRIDRMIDDGTMMKIEA